jgi:hypothetical protein
MGVRVLRTPPRAPKANAVCERVVGTIRRECLDFLIPLSQRHLKHTLNIGFRRATECVAKPCWVDCTTSIGWKRSHEHGRSHCARQVSIEPFLPGHPEARTIIAKDQTLIGGVRHQRFILKMFRAADRLRPHQSYH